MGTNEFLSQAVSNKVPEGTIQNGFFACSYNTGSSLELGVFFILEWSFNQTISKTGKVMTQLISNLIILVTKYCRCISQR